MDPYSILDACRDGQSPSVEEMAVLLSQDDPSFDEALFSAALAVRDRVFGNRLYAYGFVYFSTYCRNDCGFCYYRRSNSIDRYRKGADEVVEVSRNFEDAGINMVDLTMGEDPYLCNNGYSNLLDLVSKVRDEVDVGIMASPGALPQDVMPRLREAGADWFACYQETYNRDLFSRLRIGQDYEYRINQRVWARDAGMLTEDGMLVGVGESATDRAEQIFMMGSLGCRQMRAMTFVPQAGTPMQAVVPQDSSVELRAIAVMRLAFPDILIPASLDVEGVSGLEDRINAGANVITSIVPPDRELAGVAQPEKDIGDGHRSFSFVKNLVAGMGKRIATPEEFRGYMEANRPEVVRI